MSGININIDDNFANVTYEKNHINYAKTLTVDTFIGSLISQYGIKLPGLLPAGTRFYTRKGNTHSVYIEVSPVQRLISYVNGTHKPIFEGVVPMPWTLLVVNVREDETGKFSINDGKIFALKRPLINDDDELFHFPAANVHGNHAICWGSTFTKMGLPIKSLSEVGRAVDYYFSSEFNTDIHPRIQKYVRYEDLLRNIKGEKTFPLDVLVKANLTFEGLTKL